MKKCIFFTLFVLCLCGCLNYNTIAREDWLAVLIEHEITESTDLWRENIALKVDVNENNRTICVVFSVKQGSPEIAHEVSVQYVHVFKKVINIIVDKKEYQWAKSYDLILEYV